MSRRPTELTLALALFSFAGSEVFAAALAAEIAPTPETIAAPAPPPAPSVAKPVVAPAEVAAPAAKPEPAPVPPGGEAKVAPEKPRGKPTAGERKEARKHFARALELLDDGQVAGALLEFERSYELKPHFAVLYNIGMAHVYLGQPLEAATALERYLAEGGKAVKSRRQKEVTEEIERQKSRIAILEIRTTPTDAALRVDGKAVDATAARAGLGVAIGEHVVAALADGYEPAETRVTVAAKDRRTVSLVLAKPEAPPATEPPAPVVAPIALPPPPVALPPPPAAAVVASPPEAAAASTVPEQHRGMRIGGLVVAGTGLVGAATGMGLLFKARSLHDDALGHCTPNCDAEAHDLQSRADNYLIATNVLLIGGGVAVATGLAFYVYGWRADKKAAKVTLAPVLVSGLAALAAQGSW
jgi:hypothetical protein